MLFYQSGSELVRVGVTAVLMYIICVLFVSVFGKRSSAKMNNFDWMVTVAMGSILGSAVLLKKVVILEVALGLFILLMMQYLFTLMSVRVPMFRKLMKKSPTLLYYEGEFLLDNLNKERVTQEEVRTGIRSRGYPAQTSISAVILEPNGELSVIPKPGADVQNMLDDEVLSSR